MDKEEINKKKNGLITLISILAAAAGAIAAIFAITKKIGKKKDEEKGDLIEGPDGHIEIDIDDDDDFGVSEEEYQSHSAEIPAQEFENDDTSDDSPDKGDDEDEDSEEKPQD